MTVRYMRPLHAGGVPRILLAFGKRRPLLIALMIPPSAVHRSLRTFLVSTVESLTAVAIRFEVSPF